MNMHSELTFFSLPYTYYHVARLLINYLVTGNVCSCREHRCNEFACVDLYAVVFTGGVTSQEILGHVKQCDFDRTKGCGGT